MSVPAVEITDEEIDALLAEVSDECTDTDVSVNKPVESSLSKSTPVAQKAVVSTVTDTGAEKDTNSTEMTVADPATLETIVLATKSESDGKEEKESTDKESSSKENIDETKFNVKKSSNNDSALGALSSQDKKSEAGAGVKEEICAGSSKKSESGEKKSQTQKSAPTKTAQANVNTKQVPEAKSANTNQGQDKKSERKEDKVQEKVPLKGDCNKTVTAEAKHDAKKSDVTMNPGEQTETFGSVDENNKSSAEKSESDAKKLTLSNNNPSQSIPSNNTNSQPLPTSSNPKKSLPSSSKTSPARSNPFITSSKSDPSETYPSQAIEMDWDYSADFALAAADKILQKSRKNSEEISLDAKVAKAPVLELGQDKSGKIVSPTSVKSSEVEQSPSKSLTSPKGQTGWGWNSLSAWGSSVLNTASALTSQVGDSVVQVLEAVESSLVEPVHVVSSDNDRTANIGDSAKKKKKKKSLTEESTDNDIASDKIDHYKSSNMGGATDEGAVVKQVIDRETQPITNQPPTAGDQSGGGTSEQAGGGGASGQAVSVLNDERSSSPDADNAGWFNTWHLTQLTGAVQKQGKNVVGKGLHALETLSKKTMGVLGLDEDIDETEERVSKKMSALMKHFDECLGVVHFEALRSLSQMSEDKLTNQLLLLAPDNLDSLKADLTLVSQAFDLGDINWDQDFEEAEQDFPTLVKDFISQLSLNVKTTRLLTFHEASQKWMESCKREEEEGRSFPPQEVHQMAISMLAEFTANGVAVYHKIAQLLLIDTCTPVISYKLRALHLAGYTKVLCTEIWIQTRRFTEHVHKANEHDPSKRIQALVGNLYIEASNCCTCLQDSFGLLLPIMHLSLTRVHPLCIDNSGIAHLEGLQVIASMSKMTVDSAVSKMEAGARQTLSETFKQIESVFDLSNLVPIAEKADEGEVLSELLADYMSVESVKQASEKFTTTKTEIGKWLSDCERERSSEKQVSANDVHQKSVQCMSLFTSCCIEIYHSITQCLLSESTPSTQQSSANQSLNHANNLTSLTRMFCKEIGSQSTLFTRCITSATPSAASDDSSSDIADRPARQSVTPLITNIYLEASNSTTCIQDAYQLLLPILKLYIIKRNYSATTKLCD